MFDQNERIATGRSLLQKCLSCFSGDSQFEVLLPELQKTKNRDLEIAPTGEAIAGTTENEESRPGEDLYRIRYSLT
jgi:hypothetical protein